MQQWNKGTMEQWNNRTIDKGTMQPWNNVTM